METYLDAILWSHRGRAAADDRVLEEWIHRSRGAPAPRGFRQALVDSRSEPGVGVIAEVKRWSPSRGALFPDLDPAVLAAQYGAGGATCLSVLTDAEFFGGSADDLRAARAGSWLPVLRKDFTVSALDVCDTRLMGADCVLLIAAALDDVELSDFHSLALEIGLDVLVEIHDERELDRAMAVGTHLIGVNQRDLVTFEVDTDRARRLAALLPPAVAAVAESGVRSHYEALALAAAGYDAVLVGEALVTSGDPTGAVAELRGVPIG
jgi:indole-3-glycerol phosphate synthase